MQRFLSHVSKDDVSGCWRWVGACDDHGYGSFALDGYKVIRAHRASWRLHRGEIPTGYSVCHRCDRRHCVNPDHLFLGTAADNAHDRDAKGRAMQQRPGYVPWNKGRTRERAPVADSALVRRG